jgi:hypothetical protein
MSEKKERTRWTSGQRLERDSKKKDKPDKIRWRLNSKKIKEMKEELRKKRKARNENRKKLIEKGVIKQK